MCNFADLFQSILHEQPGKLVAMRNKLTILKVKYNGIEIYYFYKAF